jgi:hypothetical protein
MIKLWHSIVILTFIIIVITVISTTRKGKYYTQKVLSLSMVAPDSIRSIVNSEKSERFSKPFTTDNPNSPISFTCQFPYSIVLYPLADSPAKVLICTSKISNGKIGAVFAGLLLCPDETCAKGTSNKNLVRPLPHLDVAALAALNEATSVRKVAVKFNFRAAVEGRVKNDLGFTIVGDMDKEIANLKLFQDSDLVVKYLGRIESYKDNVRFLPALALSGTSEELTGPGLVMEFLEGPTVKRFVDERTDLKSRAQQLLCFGAQIILLFGAEFTQGRFNPDVHAENAIVIGDEMFTLTKETTCKKIKIIDFGGIVETKEWTDAVYVLLLKVYIITIDFPQIESNAPKEFKEMIKIVAKLLSPRKEISRQILYRTRLDKTFPLEKFASAVLAELDGNQIQS